MLNQTVTSFANSRLATATNSKQTVMGDLTKILTGPTLFMSKSVEIMVAWNQEWYTLENID